jgi:hypothetical protein
MAQGALCNPVDFDNRRFVYTCNLEIVMIALSMVVNVIFVVMGAGVFFWIVELAKSEKEKKIQQRKLIEDPDSIVNRLIDGLIELDRQKGADSSLSEIEGTLIDLHRSGSFFPRFFHCQGLKLRILLN